MASLNQCQFIGNLGKDPEIRAMQNGKKAASFSIACSESWKDKTTGERKEKTEWISLVAFDPLASVIEKYVKKGSKLFVSGSLQNRSWDAPDGTKKYKTEIVVKDLIMLDGKKESVQSGHDAGYQAGQQPSAGDPVSQDLGDPDDLPF